MKKWMQGLVIVLLCGAASISFAQIPLYYSQQQGKGTSYSGTYTKKTNKYESGSAKFTTEGPIKISVLPQDMSIGEKQEKTWSGTVSITQAPEIGTTAEASITADYTYSFDKWIGSTTDPQIETYSGSETRSFIIYSIKASLPDTICIDRKTLSGEASVTSFPSTGGSYTWRALTGSISVSGEGSKVTLKLSDEKAEGMVEATFSIEGVSYSTKAYVKACEGCSCPEITSGANFGPIAATFKSKPKSEFSDENQYCSYSTAEASFNLNLTDSRFQLSTALQGAAITFSKHCQKDVYNKVSITWSGDQSIGKIGWLDVNLKAVSLTVDASGNLSGTATLNGSLNQDKNLKDLVFIKSGVNGEFTFNFSGGNSFEGSFNFEGIRAINLELKKEGQVIANVEDGTLNSEGDFTGTLTNLPEVTYKSAQMTIKVSQLSLGFTAGLTTSFKFNKGSGQLEATDIQGVKGSFGLSLSCTSDQATITASAKDLQLFGMEISDLNAEAEFSLATFEIERIRGGLKAKHQDFDAQLDVPEMLVVNGKLEKFIVNNAQIKYKQFSFNLSNSSYTNGNLSLDAQVKIDASGSAAMLKVSEFKISEVGKVTVGGIAGEFNKAPMALSFSAKFTDNESQSSFQGNFRGKFTTVDVNGACDIGAKDDFTFAYLGLEMGGMRVPLGQSGLQLTRIGGKVGMNYKVSLDGPLGPEKGNHLIGLKLGVGDVANLTEVNGEAILQFGNNVQLNLAGDVTVLKNAPMFTGKLNVNYTLPGEKINGSFGTSIQVPSDGSILKSENLQANFAIENGSWSMNGNNMGGSIINTIKLSEGNISMSGSLNNPGSFAGSLSGKGALNLNIPVRYPSGFDATDCNSMYQTSSAVAVGFAGNLEAKMESRLMATIGQAGFCGSMESDVAMTGSIDAYVWGFCGGWTVATNGNLKVSVGCGQVGSVSGTVNIPLPFGYTQTVGVSLSL